MRELEEKVRKEKLEREKEKLERQKMLLDADKSLPPAAAPEVVPSPAPVVREAIPTPAGDAQAMGESLLLSDVIAST